MALYPLRLRTSFGKVFKVVYNILFYSYNASALIYFHGFPFQSLYVLVIILIASHNVLSERESALHSLSSLKALYSNSKSISKLLYNFASFSISPSL